tara:strand:+ start:1244 stop:1630 length:387 start_codon:yes stop_codon:yes gene_type:complete
MSNKNKNKGTYHEKWFVHWLNKIGIKAKRQPLSGSLGGEYRGDIILQIRSKDYIAEVKYRTKDNFPNPFNVLDKRDLALYKRKTGKPNTLVIMSGDIFEELMEGNYDKKSSNQKAKSSCKETEGRSSV